MRKTVKSIICFGLAAVMLFSCTSCVLLVGTIPSGNKNQTDIEPNCPEVDPNDKSVSSFADLNFNCTNSYTDAEGHDILLFDVHIDHWIQNADGYVNSFISTRITMGSSVSARSDASCRPSRSTAGSFSYSIQHRKTPFTIWICT